MQSDPKQQVTQIWESLLGVSPIAPDQNYFDLGGDSILAVQMFAQIEKVFQVKLPVATLFEAPTIGDLVEVLSREAPKLQWSSLVAIQPKGSRPPLFCVHPHGGNVLLYGELSKHLGDDQPFYGLQSRGLDGSCPPLTRIEDMAAHYISEIKSIQPVGPYYLSGYCMGGLVAYEIAQQLSERGERIGVLALIDTLNWAGNLPPSLWEDMVHTFERALFHLSNFLSIRAPEKSAFVREKWKSLETRVPIWWRRALDQLLRHRESETSEPSVLAQIWKANLRACMDYYPRPYSDLLIDIKPARQYRCFSRAELAWDRLAKDGQRVIILPVNAPAIMVEPFVRHLAEALRNLLQGNEQ